MKNRNLHRARVEKNDEFYTKLEDISTELVHYKHHFKNKKVLCNCDDPAKSAFWKYLHINFTEFGLKKLTSTHYRENEVSCKMEYTGGDDNNIEVGLKTALKGNGDFRSQECIDLLDEADIIVTNPPFSIALKYYVPLLIEHNKQFLIIGDMNWIPKEYMFPLIVKNKIWLGCNYVKEFIKPDGETAKFGNKLWFTNLDHNKRHEDLMLLKQYNPIEYPTYANYSAINVKKINEIPYDYYGLMGVPITFLLNHNPNQFEIVGCPTYKGEFGRDYLGIKRLGEEWLNSYKEHGGTGHYTANMELPVYYDINGFPKCPYAKIIIKRKM